ncbi:MAG TPA: transglutaminase-like domain-containing protein, partial [Prolixibacteraceae bacterium]|nr:transglutaminase-like domain-containing protein [Prolixibacteraceae bacterium]
LLALLFLLTGYSCAKKQELIQNKERQQDIQRMLSVQKELTSKSLIPIWDIFNQSLSAQEKQAMEFLYAYMPLSDLGDYTSDFFLKNVKMSLQAREEMPWGKIIPEEEFLHFVLPLRVNNENLDNFREVMYPEIKERIKGMDMKQAALEINHWCHEKVNYRGTDSRTSAPLCTVKKTFGRCGEESTFTVTAMRTAGIPARQVYTPRWAHTDDNHAWVEVWIDGKWNYLGACEPDVDLNMGWFSEPSKRTMLVHTRAFGHYFGSEDVVTATDRFSELNLTSHYATVKKVTIKVSNEDGSPADSAKVQYELYNYAEYYPIAAGYTNPKGLTSLNTGLGDLIIWAAKNGKFGYSKLSVPETDTLRLVLNQTSPVKKAESFDLVPPHAVKTTMNVSEDAKKQNDRRLAHEDSIRNATMATFKDSAWIAGFAQKTGLSVDTIGRLITLSYGNWEQISTFLEKNAPANRNMTLEMAIQLSDKDYSDAPEAVLTDHLVQTAQSGVEKLVPSKEMFNR